MSEERRKILDLLAEGKISAAQAEQLIAALGVTGAEQVSNNSPRNAKYLRVMVDARDDDNQGPTKVNIRVPMQLLRAGVRLSALIPPVAREQINEALQNNGIPIDIARIKAENLEDLVEQLGDLALDVDTAEAKVRIFCE